MTKTLFPPGSKFVRCRFRFYQRKNGGFPRCRGKCKGERLVRFSFLMIQSSDLLWRFGRRLPQSQLAGRFRAYWMESCQGRLAARVARVARVAQVARIARIARIARVARVARVAPARAEPAAGGPEGGLPVLTAGASQPVHR